MVRSKITTIIVNKSPKIKKKKNLGKTAAVDIWLRKKISQATAETDTTAGVPDTYICVYMPYIYIYTYINICISLDNNLII